MKKLLTAILVICSFALAHAQKFEPNWASLNTRKMPTWFQNDKFGIFIHWGLYAVPSYAPVIPNSGLSYSEWYWYRIHSKQKEFTDFHNKTYGENFPYPNFETSFRAELFEPDQWADVFKKSGARYVVLTSKHHEGYCLWDSKEADLNWGRPWNSVTGTPKRDLLGDLTHSVRSAGLKMGYYYSLYEWYNPLWLNDKQLYVTKHMIPQFKDLVTKYKPSVIFSDGEWDMPDTAWHSTDILAWLYNESPVANEVVVDDRWGHNTRSKNNGATYATSEYGGGMDASVVWEESQGIGHSYGYNRKEKMEDYKSTRELIVLLADIVARGGNLLLDIGPTADGRIPVIMQERLIGMGKWLEKNGEAIYGTKAYKNPYQWSDGVMPSKSNKHYMAGYSAAGMTKPKKDTAYVELFFTKKEKDLYCIIPAFRSKLLLKDLNVPAGATATILGTEKSFSIKNKGKNCEIDFPNLQPGDVPAELLVVKLNDVLN